MRNKKFIPPLIVLAMLLTFTPQSFAVEIKGKVVEVEGATAKIAYKSDFMPVPGDNLQIGDSIGGIFVPVDGDWRIVKVTQYFAWSESKSAETGIPDIGYLVIIQSNNPKKKSDLVDEGKRLAREAHRYMRGDEMDIPKAIVLAKKAAEKGYAYGFYQLGTIYKDGKHRGPGGPWDDSRSKAERNADNSEALKWYRKGADRDDFSSQKAMGHFYFMGLGGLRYNPVKGEEWYRRAQANSKGSVLGQLLLDKAQGAITHEHMSLEEVEKMRIKLYRKWARKGDEEARKELSKRGLEW